MSGVIHIIWRWLVSASVGQMLTLTITKADDMNATTHEARLTVEHRHVTNRDWQDASTFNECNPDHEPLPLYVCEVLAHAITLRPALAWIFLDADNRDVERIVTRDLMNKRRKLTPFGLALAIQESESDGANVTPQDYDEIKPGALAENQRICGRKKPNTFKPYRLTKTVAVDNRHARRHTRKSFDVLTETYVYRKVTSAPRFGIMFGFNRTKHIVRHVAHLPPVMPNRRRFMEAWNAPDPDFNIDERLAWYPREDN